MTSNPESQKGTFYFSSFLTLEEQPNCFGAVTVTCMPAGCSVVRGVEQLGAARSATAGGFVHE